MLNLDLVTFLILVLIAAAVGGLCVWWLSRRLFSRKTFQERIVTQHITERIRAVGRLVGLEVYAKEIATVSAGWSWLPPLLLSQARLAMIFHFEKQYFVDLARLSAGDVEDLSRGEVAGAAGVGGRFRITLPPIEGTLRLTDVTPYDIQSGRVMGLLDVIPMNAERQAELMRKAQQQAGRLYEHSDARYRTEAKLSIERHMTTLLEMFGVTAEIRWSDAEAREARRIEDLARSAPAPMTPPTPPSPPSPIPPTPGGGGMGGGRPAGA